MIRTLSNRFWVVYWWAWLNLIVIHVFVCWLIVKHFSFCLLGLLLWICRSCSLFLFFFLLILSEFQHFLVQLFLLHFFVDIGVTTCFCIMICKHFIELFMFGIFVLWFFVLISSGWFPWSSKSFIIRSSVLMDGFAMNSFHWRFWTATTISFIWLVHLHWPWLNKWTWLFGFKCVICLPFLHTLFLRYMHSASYRFVLSLLPWRSMTTPALFMSHLLLLAMVALPLAIFRSRTTVKVFHFLN